MSRVRRNSDAERRSIERQLQIEPMDLALLERLFWAQLRVGDLAAGETLNRITDVESYWRTAGRPALISERDARLMSERELRKYRRDWDHAVTIAMQREDEARDLWHRLAAVFNRSSDAWSTNPPSDDAERRRRDRELQAAGDPGLAVRQLADRVRYGEIHPDAPWFMARMGDPVARAFVGYGGDDLAVPSDERHGHYAPDERLRWVHDLVDGEDARGVALGNTELRRELAAVIARGIDVYREEHGLAPLGLLTSYRRYHTEGLQREAAGWEIHARLVDTVRSRREQTARTPGGATQIMLMRELSDHLERGALAWLNAPPGARANPAMEIRRNMDERLRGSEREARRSGAPEDEVRLLVERMRAGAVDPEAVALAAVLGDEASRLVVPGWREEIRPTWRVELAVGAEVALRPAHVNYVLNQLRFALGDQRIAAEAFERSLRRQPGASAGWTNARLVATEHARHGDWARALDEARLLATFSFATTEEAWRARNWQHDPEGPQTRAWAAELQAQAADLTALLTGNL